MAVKFYLWPRRSIFVALDAFESACIQERSSPSGMKRVQNDGCAENVMEFVHPAPEGIEHPVSIVQGIRIQKLIDQLDAIEELYPRGRPQFFHQIMAKTACWLMGVVL